MYFVFITLNDFLLSILKIIFLKFNISNMWVMQSVLRNNKAIIK